MKKKKKTSEGAIGNLIILWYDGDGSRAQKIKVGGEVDFLVTTLKFIYARVASQRAKRRERK